MVERTLQFEGESPEEIKIMLTAPTGSVAFNIGAITIHAALLLPINRGNSYVRLSEDKRNTLRLKLAILKLLIIDEISMVGAHVIIEVHRRLCDIMGNDRQFGGVSLVAVGYMFLLAPIGQQFIFGSPKDIIAHIHCQLWQDHFKMAVLAKIIRQGDDGLLASNLNIIRTGHHTDEDFLCCHNVQHYQIMQIIQHKLFMSLPEISKVNMKQHVNALFSKTSD